MILKWLFVKPEANRKKLREFVMYYVYGLLDTRDGTLFYIGKGKDARAMQHCKAARVTEKESDKEKRINEIEAAGFDVREIILIKSLNTEAEAFVLEAFLIHQALTEKIACGITTQLTNAVNGHHRDRFRPIGESDYVPGFEITDALLKTSREGLLEYVRPGFERIMREIDRFQQPIEGLSDYLKSHRLSNGFEFVVYCRDAYSVEFQYYHRGKSTDAQKAHALDVGRKLGPEYAVVPQDAKVRWSDPQLTLARIDNVVIELRKFIGLIESRGLSIN